MGPIDDLTRAIVTPMVQKAALTQAFDEAWFALALLFALLLDVGVRIGEAAGK